MRRRAVALVVAIGLVLAAAGVAAWRLVDDGEIRSGGAGGDEIAGPGPTGSSSPTPAGSAGARKAPDPALQPYYDQRVDWQECGSNQCALIEVPLDYDEPGGERIELALLKNPADNPDERIGPLVVNPGGPGSPGTSMAAQASFYLGRPLLDRFDVVGFDPRGTGSSTAIDCLTDDQLDDYIAGDPDPDDPAEVRGFRESLQLMGQGCVSRSEGKLAAHVSTVEAARDMDVIRAVLGQDHLDYVGFSYGTKLGATYVELFPQRSGRVVLDGAVDVSLGSRELSLQQAHGFQVALNAYVDHCVEEGSCVLGDSREEAIGTITDLLDEIEEEPMPVGDRELRIGNAFYGLIAPLYLRDLWPYLTRALTDALKGDGSTLLRLSDAYTSRRADGTYADNSSEAIYAINCLDDPSFTPIPEIPEQYAAFEEASPTFGRVFAWGLAGCAGLAVEPTQEEITIDGSGADPLLVLGTTRDPATPYRWAVALAEQLESAVLVSRDGDGHTAYNQGNACVDDVVEGYLLEGEVPEDDVDCPAA